MKMERGESKNSRFRNIFYVDLLILEFVLYYSLNNETPSLDDARKFLYSLQEKELQSNDCKRGPFLAELELERRVISEKSNFKPAKEMDTLVIEYFKKFGSKACCYEDLHPYLKNIPLETSKKFIEEFKASIDNTCEDTKVNKMFSDYLFLVFIYVN